MTKRPKNFLLGQLPQDDFDRLEPDLRCVELKVGDALFEPDQAVHRVVFPESGLLSVITVMASGAMAETAMVGRNGAVGFVEACGSGRISSRVLVQVGGTALCAPASRYRAAHEASKSFRAAIATNIELQLAELRQTLACNSLHPLDQRLARWLLDCPELSGCGDVLPLTQEFLSAMLSVQRTSVTAMMRRFESDGLLHQGRGKITILNREGLVRRTCECRATIARLRTDIEPRAMGLADERIGEAGRYRW